MAVLNRGNYFLLNLQIADRLLSISLLFFITA